MNDHKTTKKVVLFFIPLLLLVLLLYPLNIYFTHDTKTIPNDGISISEDKIPYLLTSPENKSMGLTNIDCRLKRIYGHGIQITSKVNAGTIVSIKFPDERKEV